MGHRIALPERLPDYLHRPSLADRCEPTARHLTLVVAPGGFGKTTLLAESCRDARSRGIGAAWLALDSGDDPEALDTHLAHAFGQAGLDVVERQRSGAAPLAPHPRTALVLQAVETLGAPFVLALDGAERLVDPAAIGVLNYLLAAAPANLHIAVAARELPPGVDVLSPRPAGAAAILTADDLRFSRDEVARFFGGKLSHRELKRLVSASAGWPIALRIRRNERLSASERRARVVHDAMGSWIESRLWGDFESVDRELLLDVGLFDWFDAPLLDAVLDDYGAMARLETLRPLDGLFERVRGDSPAVLRLHPLIREHCANRRRRSTPARYRQVHAGIARALAARGCTVEAMQHAGEAADRALLAGILVDAGGVRLCLREGVDDLVAADRLIPEAVIARHPRLGPARCAALAATGKLSAARRLFAALPTGAPDSGTDADRDLYLDRCLARAVIAHFGCETAHTDETLAMFEHVRGLAAQSRLDTAARVGIEFMLCVHSNLRADFDETRERALRLKNTETGRAPFIAPAVDIQLGLLAMARGRVDEAMSHYRSARRLARAGLPHAPRLVLLSDLLVTELNLERNAVEEVNAISPLVDDFRRGAELTAYFAACDIAVELTLAAEGVDGALPAVDRALAHARDAGLPALARHLAAVRVSLLADAGRIVEARRTWAEAALPAGDRGCLDSDGQSWREFESVCCARLRLLTAQGEFAAGRRFADALLSATAGRRLRRTEMRTRALGVTLEHRAGSAAARSHLAAFLALFEATDYARPLVREGEPAATTLRQYLAARDDAPTRGVAESLLATVVEGQATAVPRLTARESDVLVRLDAQRDDDIARELGITRHGVRYHVQNLYRKLNARTRREAVRRARALGLLPDTD